MPVIRRETVGDRPEWLNASTCGAFRAAVGHPAMFDRHYHDADEKGTRVGSRRTGHLYRDELGDPVPQHQRPTPAALPVPFPPALVPVGAKGGDA